MQKDIPWHYHSVGYKWKLGVCARGHENNGFWSKMAILDLLVYVYCFFLNPYQWGSRGLFPKYEGDPTGGPPIPVSLCLGNGYLKQISKQGCGREFLVWLQNWWC